MPMMLSAIGVPLWCWCISSVRHHPHLRKAQDATIADIAWPENVHDGAGDGGRGVHDFCGLHQGRVKRLPQAWDFAYVETTEQVIEALTRQQIPFDQGSEHLALGEPGPEPVQPGQATLRLLHTAT